MVTVGKGPEYVPVTVAVEVLAERDMPPLELRLERKVNMAARGWYCGDMHAHVIHGERYVPATMAHGAVGGRAEGLDCYFATHTWDGVEAEADYRTKLAAQLSTDRFKADWNWEVKWFPGGHCWEIGTHWEKPEAEYPLGPYPHPGGVRAHFEAHHAIHQRGGIVGFTHPNVSHNPATELPLDLLAGPTFDAVDIMTTGANASNEKTWYLINAWYIVRCVGDHGRLAVSSPIYFRQPDFQPPQPLQARVAFRITSADGKPITAQVEAFNYGKPLAAFTAEDGRLTCAVPPTAWFKISAADHKAATRSIFFDVPEIFQASTHAGLSLQQKESFLITWDPVDKMARLLQNIQLDVKLPPK